MKWERIYRVGAGLHNLGNTCFLNSTVQCLTYTPPLANYLLSKEHSRSCEWGAPGSASSRAGGAGGEEERLPVLLPVLHSAHGSGKRHMDVRMCLLCSLLPVSLSEVDPAYNSPFLVVAVFLSFAALNMGRLCCCWA